MESLSSNCGNCCVHASLDEGARAVKSKMQSIKDVGMSVERWQTGEGGKG